MKRLVSLLLVVLSLLTINPLPADANSGDFSGGVAIGTGYAGVNTAPTNGLIVQGNTGHGTTSPDALLSLSGQAAQTIDMVRETTASTAGNNLTIQAGGAVSGGTNLGGGALVLSSGTSTGNNTSNVQIQTYPAGSSGTADASALTALTVSATGTAGSNAATTLQGNAGSGTNKNGGTLTLASGVSTGTGTSGINFNVYGAGSSGSSANAATTAITITSTPNVGIGTSSPSSTLHVFGPMNPLSNANERILNVASTDAMAADVGGGIGFGGYYTSTNAPTVWAWVSGKKADATSGNYGGYLIFGTRTTGSNTAERMRIDTNGNVGIGTPTPRGGALLDVNGKLYVATFAASTATTVCQNGNVLSSCTSALRFKKNIQPSELGLKEVLAMRPVTFDFKDHKDNWEKHDFGFVAEDMEKINPLFVTYDENGKIIGVRYMQLAAVNAKAIQELHHLAVEQREQIDQQQVEIDQLKASLQKLERQRMAP